MFGRLISDTKHKSMLKTNKFLNDSTFRWNLTFEILISICFRCGCCCRIRIQTNEFLYLTIRRLIFNFNVCFHFKSNSWNLFLLSFVCQAAITYEWDENIPRTIQKIYEKEKRREDEEEEERERDQNGIRFQQRWCRYLISSSRSGCRPIELLYIHLFDQVHQSMFIGHRAFAFSFRSLSFSHSIEFVFFLRFWCFVCLKCSINEHVKKEKHLNWTFLFFFKTISSLTFVSIEKKRWV